MRAFLLSAVLVATAFAGATADGAGVLTIFTAAGGDTQGFAGDGVPATRAALNGPQDVVVAPDGSLLIADTINQRIRRIDSANRIRTVAGNGDIGFSGDGGPARNARFQDPSQIAVGKDGTIVVADTGNSRVRVIRPDGSIGTLAGTADQGFSGDGGPATAAQVKSPAGVAIDAAGQVFFSDTGNNRVRRIAANGIISTIAADLSAPTGLAFAPDGSLLVADTGNNRIRRVAPDGTISTIAGTGGGGSGGDGGPAAGAQLNRPVDIVVHPRGGYFIVEQGGNRVRHVDSSGNIARVAGTGAPRYGGDGKASAGSYLNAPRGVELLPSGNELLIADADNNRIRYIAIPGQATRAAFAWIKPVVNARLYKKKITVKKRKRRVLAIRPTLMPFSVTRPGTLAIRIATKKPRRLVTSFRLSVKAGSGSVRLPARLRSGKRRLAKDHYVVSVDARAGSASSADSLELIVK